MLLFAYPELTKNEARIAASSAVNVLFTIRGVGSSSRTTKTNIIKGLPGQLSSVHAESARLVTEKSMEEGSSAAASTKRIIPGTNTEMLEALFQNPDSVTKQWLSGVFESHPEACESPQEPYEGISRPTEEQKKYIQELLAGASQATADVVTEAILFPQQNRADRQTDRDKSRSEKMGEPHQPKSTASPEQRMHHSSPIQEESPVIFQKENPLIVPTMDNAIRELAGHSVEGLAVFAQAIGNDRLATKIVDIGMGAMKFAENVQKISKIVHAASSIGKGVSTVMLASSIIGTVVTVFSTISSLFSSDDSSEAFQAVQRQIQRLEGVFIQGIDFLAQLNEEVRQEMIKGFGDAKDQMSQNQYFTMLGFLQSSRQSGEIQTILHVRTNELFRQIEATSSSHDQKLTSELMKETLAALSAIANHLVRASGKPLSEIPYDEAKRLCAILEDGLIANNTNSPVTIGMGAFNGAVYGDLSDNAIIKLSSSLTAGDQPGFFLRVLKDKFKLSSSLDPNMIPNLRLALHEALPYLELRSAMNPAYHYDDNGVMPKRIEEGVRRWYAFSEFARRPEVWEALYSYYDEAIRQFRPLLVEAAQEIEQEKFDLLVGSVPASQRSGRDLSTHRVSILFSVPEMLDGVDRHPLDERIHPIIGNPVPGLERLSPNDCERELNTDVVVGPNVHCDPTEPIRLQSGELCHLMVGTNVKVGRDDPSGYKFTCTQHKTERYGQYCDACTLTSAPRFPAPTEKCPDLKTSDGKDFAVQRLISQEDRLHEDMLISEMSLWYSANVEGGQFEAIASKQNGTVTRVGSINIGPGQKLGLVEGTMRRLNSERLQTMWRMGALQGGRPGARRLWEDKQKRDKTVEEIVEERLRWLCKAVSTLSTPGGVRSERWTAALKQLTAARALLYTFCQIAGVSEDECQKHFASLHTAKEMELYQDPAFWSSLGGKKPPLPPEADDVTVENRTAMIQDLFNRTDNLDTGPVLAPVAYLVKAFSDFESKHAQTVAEQLKNESDLPLQLSSAKSGDMASEISRLTQRVSELGKRLEKQTQEMKETKELLQRIEQHEAKLMEILQILQSNGCAAKD